MFIVRVGRCIGAAVRWAASPFVDRLGLTMLLVAIQAVVPLMYFGGLLADGVTEWTSHWRAVPVTIHIRWVIAETMVYAWLAVLVYTICARVRWLRRIWLTLVFTVTGLNWLWDALTMATYGQLMNIEIFHVLLASNLAEAKEFVGLHIGWSTIAQIFGSIVAITVVWALARGVERLAHRYGWLRAVIGVAGLLTVIYGVRVIDLSEPQYNGTWSMRGKWLQFIEREVMHTMEPQHPALVRVSTDTPRDIVLIIGESSTPLHSSLYGYRLETNPRLAARLAAGELELFHEARASELTTLTNIRQSLTAWRRGGGVPVHKSDNIIEIARLTGYRTAWLSNQSSKGFCDNPIHTLAQYCDTMVFTNDGHMSWHHGTFDGELLPIVKGVMAAGPDTTRLTIIHLMGSHFEYNQRFPADRTPFTAADYPDRLPRLRQTLADYDNSLHYTDSVVDRIMELYRHRDALVIYLSDHGEDIYVSSDDWVGHGRASLSTESIRAGLRVPLIVYTTDSMRHAHPGLYESIRHAAKVPGARTRFTMATLMHVMGVRFAHNDSTLNRSYFAR